MRIPKSKSPVKTNLGSPAIRDRRLGPVSPSRGSVVTSPQTNGEKSVKRRLDFGAAAASLPRPGAAELTNGYHTPEDDDVDEETIMRGADADRMEGDDDDENDEPVNVDEFLEITGTGFYDVEAELERVSAENSLISNEEEEVTKPVASKGRGRPARAVPAREDEDEDEEVVPAPRRRGRNAKSKVADEPAPRPNPKRRRSERESLSDDATPEEAEASEPEEAPEPKRQRTAGKGKRGRKPAEEAATQEEPESPEAPRPKKGGRKRRSSGVADVSVVVPRGPPLPKSRGLLIARRETPGDGMTQTRSGRQSFRPLAFWRNERVDYDTSEAVEDAFAGGHRGRFLLPAIKEVHRVDEEAAAAPSQPRRRAAGKRRAARRHDSDDDDDGPAESWEVEGDGTVTGEVLVWRPEWEERMPDDDDEVEVEMERLAVSHAGAQTHEVRDATFGFAKTLSMPFFGAGVVDLPPGAEKRLKNARRMHMTFFVFSGRLRVTVAETTFRIAKGGMWFVPRGEFLSPSSPRQQGLTLGSQATTTASSTTTTATRASSSRRPAR